MAEVEKAKHLLADLFDYYAAHIDEVPEDYRAISEATICVPSPTTSPA